MDIARLSLLQHQALKQLQMLARKAPPKERTIVPISLKDGDDLVHPIPQPSDQVGLKLNLQGYNRQ